ncbi:MAG: TcpQ domain-containing protein [Alphaproteobacteria bacterium]
MLNYTKSLAKLTFLSVSTISIFAAISSATAGFEWVPVKREYSPPSVTTNEPNIQSAPVTAVESVFDDAPAAVESLDQSDLQILTEQNPPMTIRRSAIRPTPEPSSQVITPAPFEQAFEERVIEQEQSAIFNAPPQIEEQPETAMIQEPLEQELNNEAPIALHSHENQSLDTISISENKSTDVKQVELSWESPSLAAPVVSQPAMQPAVISQPEVSETQPLQVSQYETIYGFGSDMPLAIAMQQIIPEGHAYSFARSVNPGVRVSWEGDKSWNIVLQEMLKPVGLEARISGNTVIIIKAEETGTLSSSTYNNTESMLKIEPAAGEVTVTTEQEESALSPVVEQDAAGAIEEVQSTPTSDIGNVTSLEQQDNKSYRVAALSIPADQNNAAYNEKDILKPIKKDANTTATTDIKVGKWNAQKGQNIRKILYSWAERENIHIVWEASHDFLLENDVNANGDINDAIIALFETGMPQSNTPNFRIIDRAMNSGKVSLLIVQDPAAPSATL